MRSEPPLWQWRAVDQHGNRRSGRLHAHSAEQAHSELAAQGLVVRRLRCLRVAAPRLSAERLALRLQQLAGLLQAGLGLLEALEQLAINAESAAEHHGWSTLERAIAAGQTLSAALAATSLPRHAPLGSALIGVGEHSGQLATVLARLAEDLDARSRLKHRLAAPLRYPALVTLFAVALMLAMLLQVVPTFAALYAEDTAALPLPTRVLFTLSSALAAQLEGGLTALLALLLGGLFAYRHKARLARRLPLLGALLRASDRVAILDALALAQRSGLGLDRALELIAAAQGSPTLNALAAQVAQGEPLSVALRAQRAFGPLCATLVANGERSGRLAEAFSNAAEHERRGLERRLARLELLLEPIVMTLLTLVIGLMVIALYLPVFDLGSQY